MIEKGKFDTDTAALSNRINAHDKYGSFDLNGWIFDHLALHKGLSVLDLGCGTGKQTIPMALAVSDSGKIVAVDVSEDALKVLSKAAAESAVENRIETVHCALDELGAIFHDALFDRVLGSYSLYYAQNPVRLFQTVARVLKPGGVFFFCGPSGGNNRELKQFHYSLRGGEVPRETGAAVFMDETGRKLAGEYFTRVEIFSFENPLGFDSAEGLCAYWSSYNLFDASLEGEFRTSALRYFQSHRTFVTVKRGVGVRAVGR